MLAQFKEDEKFKNSLAGDEFKTQASEHLEMYLASRKDNKAAILNGFQEMEMKVAALRDKVEEYYLTGADAEAHRDSLFERCPNFSISEPFHFAQLAYPVIQQLEAGLGENR